MAKDPYQYFRIEARELLEGLSRGVLQLEHDATPDIAAGLLRLAHTLKGAARVVRQTVIAEHAHAVEDVLSPLRDSGVPISPGCIDQLLRLLDGIGGRIAALDAAPPDEDDGSATSPPPPLVPRPTKAPISLAPTPPGPALSPSQSVRPPTPPEVPRTVRADVGEVDGLVEGLVETGVQLKAIRKTAELAGRAVELVNGWRDRATTIAPTHGERYGSAIPTSGVGDDPRLERTSIESLRGLLTDIERQLSTGVDRIEREVRQVRDAAERLRLLRAETLFAPLERTARDVARSLEKEIVFEARGGEIRMDASVLAGIQGALVQLVRNAVAHGIEGGEQRRRAGKPPAGRVEVEVGRHENRVRFTCRDDGAGIDLDAVRRVAASRNLVPEAAPSAGLDQTTLLDILLKGGLTTSEAVTSASGRGVGLDVVREACARLGGQLAVHTESGEGTRFELVLPLSLSGLDALLVEVAGTSVALPLAAVRRVSRIGAGEIARAADGDSIVHDGQTLPLVALAALIGRAGAAESAPETSRPRTILVVDGAAARVAVSVDRLLGTGHVVVRALPVLAPAEPIAAGAALDAHGIPQLVLDPDHLAVAALRRGRHLRAPVETRPAASVLVIDDSLTTRMLEQSILESAGYAVDLAVSAEEGLEKARRRSYQLFLVDVEMPGMDGFAFVERTRADPVLRGTPAILVTSRNAPADRRRGEDAGARAYIVKSEFNQEHLLQTIRRLVA